MVSQSSSSSALTPKGLISYLKTLKKKSSDKILVLGLDNAGKFLEEKIVIWDFRWAGVSSACSLYLPCRKNYHPEADFRRKHK